ncbi:MAG: diadenylate cyclase CdaA [Lachnospiraceae bacterium]|jgi:diadenylate cyclase|nr:diadenylate cyclase CdaA [Lachnospiraceae bacterium]
MINEFGIKLYGLYEGTILKYWDALVQNPFQLIILIIDLAVVIYLIYKMLNLVKDTRAWQLLKGILLLIAVTWLSGVLKLNVLNFILTSFMTYGVILLIVIFQPELRRALEGLGTNKISRFFGIDKDVETKTKENIYKIVLAVVELSKARTGALIVFARDIKINDIISTGVIMDSEISHQLLVNIFVPKTPLHDGAVIIEDNKIKAAAAMLPLASDKDISRELGTRHRAAIGISKESDALAIVVSEETGKISIAKDGTLIADLKEDNLKKILIKNIIADRFNNNEKKYKERIKKIRQKISK